MHALEDMCQRFASHQTKSEKDPSNKSRKRNHDPSKTEWDLTNGPCKEVATAIRFSGLGVRSGGPVGDFLDVRDLS